MNMQSKEFDCITAYDLNLKIEGFYDSFKARREMDRFMAYSAHIAPYLNRKEVAKLTLETFMPLSWDEDSSVNDSFDDKKEAFKDLMKQVNG